MMVLTAPLVAGLALTSLVGASLGLLGAGGSIVMLPVLVYVMGVDARAAVPLSLVVVGTASLFSAVMRSGQGDIQWGTALLFGSAALAGAWLGSRLTYLVPAVVLLLSFGVLLVIVGLQMWRGRTGDDGAARRRRSLPMLAAGGLVGMLTGFLGVGGGFLIVPALMKVGGLHIRQSVSTSLVVIAMSSAAGLAAHLARGAAVPVALALLLIGASSVGTLAGTWGARGLSGPQLQRGFALFVLAVGFALIFINLPAALGLIE